MKTTNVENNPGPASIMIVNGERDIQVICSSIMAERDVEKNPLQITDAKVHTCELDQEKGIARREYDGKVRQANFEIMQEQRNARVIQDRKIENENGEIVEYSEFERRKLQQDGKMVNFETYKNSRQLSKTRASGGYDR